MKNDPQSMNDIAPFAAAERHVEKLLLSYGHTILARNYLVPKMGEIDLISFHGGTIYATEVKARQTKDQFGSSSRFTRAKQQKVIKTLYHYLARNRQQDRDLGLLAAEVFWDKDYVIRDCVIREWEM